MKQIDLTTWSRRPQYEFFRRYDYPHFNLCVSVEVTALRALATSRGLSFFRAALYVALTAVNRMTELRQRIRGDGVVEHRVVHPRFTASTPDGLYTFCYVDYTPDASAFFAAVDAAQARVARGEALQEIPDRDDLVFVTTLPWVSFSSIQHPIQMQPVDSIPRLAWGRFREEGGRLMMPLSVQVHHALVDGRHAAAFINTFEELAAAPEQILAIGG